MNTCVYKMCPLSIIGKVVLPLTLISFIAVISNLQANGESIKVELNQQQDSHQQHSSRTKQIINETLLQNHQYLRSIDQQHHQTANSQEKHQQSRSRPGRRIDQDLHSAEAIGKPDVVKSSSSSTMNSHQRQSHNSELDMQLLQAGFSNNSTTSSKRISEVSFGAKVVLSIVLATILLVISATLFDFIGRCDKKRKQRRKTKGDCYGDDLHSQVDSTGSDANTESMLIHETESSSSMDDDYVKSSKHSEKTSELSQLLRQIFFSFSLCHSWSTIFKNTHNTSDKIAAATMTAKVAVDVLNSTRKNAQYQQQHEHEQEQEGRKQLSIDSLHGLRFFSMIWIIIIHTYSFAFQWSFFKYNTSENIYKTAASQLIANGAFACDSFFLISGFLLPYLTFPAYKSNSSISSHGSREVKNNNNNDNNNTHLASNKMLQHSNNNNTNKQQLQHLNLSSSKFKFTLKNLQANLLHRYLRMMPLMMAIIGLSATLLRYLGEGPAWDYSTQMYDKWCRTNWWINGLFLHNFLDRENMCLSHSWYAAVDLQLFLLGQVILFCLARSKFLGISLCCLCLVGGQIITALITIINHLPALPLHTSVSQQSMSLYYGEIYIKPYCRASPYLIGILLAYLMRTTPLGEIRLKRWQTITGWTLSIGALLVILLSTLPTMNGQPFSDLESALYNALSRPLWACATGWMVFACITNHGGLIKRLLSAHQFVPFSRLSYSAFLIHPIVMAISYGGRQASVPFSHYLMLCLILGNIVITYLSAFILSALFELPLLSVERAIKRTWRKSRGDEDINNKSSCETPLATPTTKATATTN